MQKSLLTSEGLDYYFASYSQVGIHYDMLKDKSRTLSYRNSIINNPGLFKDKIVMDIGCGTGILSMFAAQAGAKKVLAIEMASILNMAKRIVKENGFENTIEFCKGRIEEVKIPVEKVDIIVSEWMGYLLLFEGMFDSVIYARDKYLAKGGMLFPNVEEIYVAGFENYDFAKGMEEYKDCEGINFEEFIDVMYTLPAVEIVEPNQIVTNNSLVIKFDLEKVSVEDLDFSKQFRLKAKKQGVIHGLVLWFDSLFTHGKEVVNLSTSPYSKATHWKQGLFYLKEPVTVNTGDSLDVILTMKKHPENHRNLDIRIDYKYKKGNAEVKHHQFYTFK